MDHDASERKEELVPLPLLSLHNGSQNPGQEPRRKEPQEKKRLQLFLVNGLRRRKRRCL